MQRLSLVLALAALAVAGCDQDPSSVEDFDIQPNIVVSARDLTVTTGQRVPPTFTVRYQGLDAVPEATSEAPVVLELVEETGTAEAGTRTYAVSYADEVSSGETVERLVVLRSPSGGREITGTVRLRVVNPISISESFTSRLAVVADYEARAVETSGGTTAETVTDGVSPNSSGLRALRVSASGAGAVTFRREVSAPGQGVFSFLLKPDPAADFTLGVTFVDRDGDETEAFTVDVPVEAGATWRRYSIDTEQVLDGFDPVAARAGGNGPLESVSFSASAPVTYALDDVAFGTVDGPTIEVDDFEAPSNPYNCGLGTSDADPAATASDGATSRRFVYTGGDCFGYNYERLRLDAGPQGELRFLIGDASADFNLYVFVETVDDGGRAGGFSFDNGNEVAVEEGDGYRLVTIPLSELGNDPSALNDPGIVNVGFSVRRKASDATTDPIAFTIDDVKLVAGT